MRRHKRGEALNERRAVSKSCRRGRRRAAMMMQCTKGDGRKHWDSRGDKAGRQTRDLHNCSCTTWTWRGQSGLQSGRGRFLSGLVKDNWNICTNSRVAVSTTPSCCWEVTTCLAIEERSTAPSHVPGTRCALVPMGGDRLVVITRRVRPVVHWCQLLPVLTRRT